MFIIPEWNMVIVRLGLDQNEVQMSNGRTYSEFLRRIGAALTDMSSHDADSGN